VPPQTALFGLISQVGLGFDLTLAVQVLVQPLAETICAT